MLMVMAKIWQKIYGGKSDSAAADSSTKNDMVQIFEKKSPEKTADGLTAEERKQRAIATAKARDAERASKQVTIGKPAENVSTTVGKKKNVIKGGRLMSDIPDRSALRTNRKFFTRTSSRKIFSLKY